MRVTFVAMALRDLPSVDGLARTLSAEPLPWVLVVESARRAVEEARRDIERGGVGDAEAIARSELAGLVRLRSYRVINATGVLLHTNLGRAPLAAIAAEAARTAAVDYTPLEFDLDSGARGKRGEYVRRLLTELTGAEAALVVNNNAGALFLALAALAGGSGAAVSRGELIEIGGSFRLPELMAASGAHMIEVGTTNRTRLSDYEAVARRTGVLLKVHPSNYRVDGFTSDASITELAQLAASSGSLLVADIGSGLLDETTPWVSGPPPQWLAGEPGAVQAVRAGAAVTLFSGDKLLGGPQAGIAVGTREAIGTMARHPVARAVRCDGPTLAALGATLELYADGRGADVPFWEMALAETDELEERSRRVVEAAGIDAAIEPGSSVPGAGSVPGLRIPSPTIKIGGKADAIWPALLRSSTPVVARREDGGVVLDLRTVGSGDDDAVAAALLAACR